MNKFTPVFAAVLLLFAASAASANDRYHRYQPPEAYDSRSEMRYEDMTAKDCIALRAQEDFSSNEDYNARQGYCRKFEETGQPSNYVNDPTVYKGAPKTKSAGNRNYDYY